MPLEAETLEMEGFDEGESAEYAEATRGRGGPRINSSYSPRQTPGAPPVSQGQLQAALGKVDSNLRKVSDVESSLNSRVSSLAAASKKETADRKKALDGQVKDLNQKLQLLALLPLLIQTPSTTLQTPLKDSNGNPTVTAVSTPDTSKLDAILPLLLVSGLGGSTGAGGGGLLGGDGGSDSSMLLLALVLAFSGSGK